LVCPYAKRVAFRIDEETLERLKLECKASRVSVAQFIRDLIEEALA
jgi:predicted HicB family RNase H-like nuclease